MTEVHWLDDDEQQAWRSLMAVVRHLQATVNAPLQSETGLTDIDYAVLVMLSESPERQARMSDLGEYAAASSSQLAYRIDRLVKLGYIERRMCPTDRRGSLAYLTDQGLAALDEAAQFHVACVRREVIDKLDKPDLLTLGGLLDQIVVADD